MVENQLIARFLKYQKVKRQDVICPSGDDAAIISSSQNVVVTVDSQVFGTHFDNRFSAYDVGYKSLSVCLSDIAAMAAIPTWSLVSLTFDKNDQQWLDGFSQGFCDLAAEYNIECVGGNLSKGPLAIHVTLMGQAGDRSTLQDTAQVGDLIVVTGSMGAPAWALTQSEYNTSLAKSAFNEWARPGVLVAFAQAISGNVHASIDLSDGLYADLLRLLNRSKVGADVNVSACPYHEVIKELDAQSAADFAWMGGESYQLCFTVSASNIERVQIIAQQMQVRISVIGRVVPKAGIHWQNLGSRAIPKINYYEHFSGE